MKSKIFHINFLLIFFGINLLILLACQRETTVSQNKQELSAQASRAAAVEAERQKIVDIKVVPGEMVDQTKQIMTILDPAILWIDAEIF